MAFVSANKLRLELLKAETSLTSRVLTRFIETPSKFLGMTLLGNNIALVVMGLFSTELMKPILNQWLVNNFGTGTYEFTIMLIQTLLTTVLVLIFGEFIPKALFQINATRILRVLAIPLQLIYITLWPFVIFVLTLTRLMLKSILGIDTQNEKQVFSRVDLEEFVENFSNNNTEEEDELNTEIFSKSHYIFQDKSQRMHGTQNRNCIN